MKLFISHSGGRSRKIAVELHQFVRKLVPSTDPWISTGIDKGSRWIPEIAENLEAANFGIVCITSDNLQAPWLLFEAGALSKRLDGKVCTFLLDVEPSAVEAPLSQFQHTSATKPDVLELIESINRHVAAIGARPRVAEDLKEQFESLWPNLQRLLTTVRGEASGTAPRRSTDDMLKEVLETVRGLARDASDTTLPWGGAPLPRELPPLLKEGDLVMHPQFGEGKVLDVKPLENDFKLTIQFKTVGQKVLRWAFARLSKIEVGVMDLRS
jgi:hypothetical protein